MLRNASTAAGQGDDDDLLAMRLTGDAVEDSEAERDYTDDLEDLVSLSLAKHLTSTRSHSQLQLSSEAGLSPNVPVNSKAQLYAAPRIPIRCPVPLAAECTESIRTSARARPRGTLQAGRDGPPMLRDPLTSDSYANAQADADHEISTASDLQPPEKRALTARPRLATQSASRIPVKRPHASRSVSQPATTVPTRTPTPRRHVPGPDASVSTSRPNRAWSTRHPVSSELELNALATPPPRKVFPSSDSRPRAASGPAPPKAPKSSDGLLLAVSRPTVRGPKARVSTSRRSVSTSRLGSRPPPWNRDAPSDDSSPLPPWSDDSGPRIYRSSDGELTFAAEVDSSTTPPTRGSLHRPQDLVVPTVAKRIEADRLKRLQGEQDDAWLVSEWGKAGEPRRAFTMPSQSKLAKLAPADQLGPCPAVRKFTLVEHFNTSTVQATDLVSRPHASEHEPGLVKAETPPSQSSPDIDAPCEPRLPPKSICRLDPSAESAHGPIDADKIARYGRSRGTDREVMLGLKSLVAVASAAVVLFAQASTAATVPELGVSKRGVSSTANAVARRNAVKAALARRREDRVKRASRSTWGSRAAAAAAAPVVAAPVAAPVVAAPVVAAPAAAAPVSAASSSGAADSSVLFSGSALAAATIRCGSSFTCTARTSPPANADAVCLNRRCAFSCRTGYGPSSDGATCVQSANFCGSNACVQPANGYTQCSADGQTCVPGCNTGYTGISSSGGAFRCVNPNLDASYCGPDGVVCPASYNGIGEAACAYGICRLACPAGSFQRSAQSTTNPLYCYNGESSLVN
ncbi:hypothetical protein JCM3774_006297 [Rhodotorula dairenensis]